jgi:hypothetical protein
LDVRLIFDPSKAAKPGGGKVEIRRKKFGLAELFTGAVANAPSHPDFTYSNVIKLY